MLQHILLLLQQGMKNHITTLARPILLPVSIVIGFVCYAVEGMISDKYTPSIQSVKEQRHERLLQEENQDIGTLKEKKFVPKTIFEKNLSPSLSEEMSIPEKYKSKGS